MLKLGKQNLGNYLVEAGVITPAQLEEALRHQNLKPGGKGLLGEALVELGYCTEEDIARMVARQAGVPFLPLEAHVIDGAAMSLISAETARRYGALPLGFDKGRLLVAMRRPTDIIAIDDLRLLTGHEIQPVVVADNELEAALQNYDRAGVGVEAAAAAQEDSVEEVAVAPDEASEKPAVQLANLIFTQAVRAGASDVHIEAQEKTLRIRFRIDGVLHDVMHPPRRLHPSLVSRIKVMANMDIAERRLPQDGRITLKTEGKTVDVRVASLPAVHGEKLTLRLLQRTAGPITLSQLGFPPPVLAEYREAIGRPYGFILVTGPTGSGKSTTLYATLAALNSPEKHIVTVEDPVEYRLEGVNQIQINLRAGLTFAAGLRSILRNDPDIVMVGEIRDRETARIAVESALTGHLVLSTLHTNDAAGTITRLGDMGIEPFLTASSLVAVAAQRLVRLLCKHCAQTYELGRDELLASVPDFPLPEGAKSAVLHRPVGCLRCSHTGYRGRAGVYELLRMSDTIRHLTLERRSAQEIKEAAIAQGMVTFRRDGLRKVQDGITALEEVLRVVV
ncbi:MAG: ATPase, T2SS/T4P/T4SS family [Bacillota bacterium]